MNDIRGISSLWKTEDYWAIWLGFSLILIGLTLFLMNPPTQMDMKFKSANTVMQTEAESAPFKTIAWHQANDAKKGIKASSEPLAKAIALWMGHPHGWKNNPLDAFVFSQEQAESKQAPAVEKYEQKRAATESALLAAQQAQDAAANANFETVVLNDEAVAAINTWRAAKNAESSAKKKTAIGAYNQVPYLIGLCIFFALFFAVGVKFMGNSAAEFIKAFPVIFAIAVLAYLFSSQATMKAYGIGYAAWAILFGLLISNTIGTPKWVLPAVKTEYYIKTGLVMLGAEILFGKILAIGMPGIFVAWVVTPIVLVTTYWFGQNVLKIQSKTLNMTISADMSVCGVSAAIATASACKAKKEELTLAVGLSLVFTSIMMIVMPWVIKAVGMPHVLGGAWMGGTIDATGAVAAAGAFLSDQALYVAATIKMIQNVLIGVIAFCVAVYWSAKVDREAGANINLMEIWRRFPKFVLGFIAASIIFSALYQWLGQDAGYALIDNGVIRGFTKFFRGWFFCLAFVSIGLATNFRELKSYFAGGKPLILYVCGQTLNLILTLVMAYIMFYLVFPDITAKI
ncbi:MAG: putative sulfate exporter family transporter [Candidatus Hinthialibacter antarcticus]|nr:putative sulfate exporter family transporter [Candidatus Hinthialibacter antarcticus]